MSLSRWKLMAGVLGVSIGGLAAAASQCPKLDQSKGRAPEAPATAEAPKLPPAGAPAAPVMPPPSVPAGVTPPTLPLPSPGVDVLKLPAPAPTAEAIKLPDFAPVAMPEPTKPPKPTDVVPVGGTLPPLPESGPLPSAIAPVADAPGSPKTATPPAPRVNDLVPSVAAPQQADPLAVQPQFKPDAPIAAPVERFDVPPAKPTAAVAPVAAATKYRILLRVGEGEPTFEVKNGDDLVLKVACQKVDIKSPEKGGGASEVTARGKVRFAGFGAEGTCDELSFMAGTGEVSMSGDVKVQVKDKLGRVESELSTASMKYKIDSSAVGNALKP